jgi:hypothetical protein
MFQTKKHERLEVSLSTPAAVYALLEINVELHTGSVVIKRDETYANTLYVR